MTLANYKHTNNASSLMVGAISAGATSCICTATEGALFPSTYPFLLTLEAWSGSTVTKREIVKCTARSSDTFTIVRSAGSCPASDSAVTQTTTAFSFDPTSETVTIKHKATAEDFDDINAELVRIVGTEIPALLPKSTYNAERQLFSASSAGDDDYEITSADVTSYVNGQTFKVQADVANTGPATLKLNALTAKPIEKLSGGAFTALEDGDIIANQIFWATYNSVEDCFQFSVDPATVVVTVPDGDETTKGIYERLTDAEALAMIDTTRVPNAKQLGLVTVLPEQVIPFIVNTATAYATNAVIGGANDGSAIFIATYSSANTLEIRRLVKETKTGQYIITHTTTLACTSLGNRPAIAVAGNYVYITFNDNGTGELWRYLASDLSGVTAMTISGTGIGTTPYAMFSDGTNLYIYKNGTTNVFRKYTISGTTATYDSDITYTSSITAQGGACCDGTSVWIVESASGSMTFRKYALAGGSATASAVRIIYTGGVPNGGPVSLCIGKAGTFLIGMGMTIETNSAVLASAIKLMAMTQV